jgi:MMP 1-O-methyltransferase
MNLKTITEIQEKVELHQVKGFLADDEAAALFTWAYDLAEMGPILEIGSYCGKSSIFLGCACQARGSVLFAVDHHRGSEEHQLGEEYHDAELFNRQEQFLDSFPTFRRNVASFLLTDTVVSVVAPSMLAAKAWATPLAMVFIDGGHSHEMAKADCLTWSQFIVSGGILAVHDVFAEPADGGQGPYLAVQAVLAQGHFEWVTSVRSLAILRRC